MKSVIKRVLDGDWASLQQDIDKMAAEKVHDRVDNKKVEILANINGISVDKQFEVMALGESEKSDKAEKEAKEKAKKKKADAAEKAKKEAKEKADAKKGKK